MKFQRRFGKSDFCTSNSDYDKKVTMLYRQHRDVDSGFMATAEPADRLPLQQAGEVWASEKWSIKLHANLGWELYFQAKGYSFWEIGDAKVEVPENGAYLIREGTQHRLRRFTKGRVHFYWTVFPLNSVPDTVRSADCWRRSYSVIDNANDLLHPLQGIIREAAIKEPWQREACGWYLAALCVSFTRRAEHHHSEKPLSRHPAAERALRLMASRLEHPWRLEELARLSAVSPQHLIAIFHQEYGQTPMRALQRMRLEEARRRLQQNDETVTTIAMHLGFASSQHLASACRAVFGATPTQLRRG
jgi:AraC-like DNA-binding protein/mannose-6-phosphate isomerase-like protein (cupin superfamily)